MAVAVMAAKTIPGAPERVNWPVMIVATAS